MDAVVTGASSGIGAAIKQRLRVRGLRVHNLCRSTGVDVTNADAVRRAYNRLDPYPTLLVANAGIIHPAPFLELAVADWRRVLDVNLTGAFIVAQEHARRLIPTGRPGAMVFIGSSSGRRPSIGHLPYGVAKAGLEALGLALARGLEEYGIRVYVLCPSYVDTPMLRARWGDDLAGRELLQPGDVAAEVERLLLAPNHLDGQTLYLGPDVAGKQS